MIANKNQLADIMGVSERTLTEWQEAGMPIEMVGGRGLENQYDTAKVVEWRLQRALNGATVESAREERDRMEAKLLELRIAKEAGLLVSIDDVQPAWEAAILAARSDLLSLPARLKAAIDARYQIDIDPQMLDDEVYQALAKLAEKPPESLEEIDDQAAEAEAEE